MRKVFLIALFLVSWYLAGFFHAAHIMVLTLAEAMLFFSMYPLSWYLKKSTRLQAESFQKVRIHKEEHCICTVTLENTGALPVTKAQLKWQWQYRREQAQGHEQRRTRKWVSGRGRLRTEKETAALDAGEKLVVELPVFARFCGLFDIEVKKAYLWDYLGLFKRRFSPKRTIEVAVLPERQAVKFVFAPGSGAEEEERERELFQIREYQQGDRARDIAWKQSVRTEKLLAREYREVGDHCSDLFLHLSGGSRCEPKRVSAFYQILRGVLAGLLAGGMLPRVCWRCEDSGLQRAEVRTEQEIDLLLCRLYREEERFGALTEDDGAAAAKGFCLDLELNLFYRKKRIAAFETAGLSKQLAQAVYIGEGFDEK